MYVCVGGLMGGGEWGWFVGVCMEVWLYVLCCYKGGSSAYMHTSGIAVQIIRATIHTHVVILTMSPQGHKTNQSPTYVCTFSPPPHTHTIKGLP